METVKVASLFTIGRKEYLHDAMLVLELAFHPTMVIFKTLM